MNRPISHTASETNPAASRGKFFRPYQCLAAILAVILAAPIPHAWAGADSDWQAIEILDSGPKRKPASREEALLSARNHFLLQRKALNEFLQKYPSDPRSPQARLKLAEILATEGQMDGDLRRVSEALRMFSEVETDGEVSSSLRTDAGFRRASILMQNAPGGPEQGFRQIVAAAREFTANHPADPRGARLLVEAATVCDAVPDIKRELLLQAKEATREEPLLRRISDDLVRLDFLGSPLEFTMPTLGEGTLDLETFRGKAVLLVFWSSESPQSLLWLRDLGSEAGRLPADSTTVVTVCLDTDRDAARERAAALPAHWSVGFDGLGWDGPVARTLGINALPSVWAIDRSGVVRSINAKSDPIAWALRLQE